MLLGTERCSIGCIQRARLLDIFNGWISCVILGDMQPGGQSLQPQVQLDGMSLHVTSCHAANCTRETTDGRMLAADLTRNTCGCSSETQVHARPFL